MNINKNKETKEKKTIKEIFSEYAEGYRSLPDSIKTKCLLYVLLAIGGFAGCIAAPIIMKQIGAIIPFVGMLGFGIYLFFSNVSNHIKGKILILEGDCYAVELTPVKNTAQKVYFKHNDINICLRLKERYKKIQKGDHLTVYILDTTPMYEDRGTYIINNYVAVQITSTVNEVQDDNTGSKISNIIKFNKK